MGESLMLIIGLGYGAFSITLKTDSEIHTWDGAMELLRSTNEIENCLDTITKIFLVGNDLSTKTLTIYDANRNKKIDFTWWDNELADTVRDESMADTQPQLPAINSNVYYNPAPEYAVLENILANVSEESPPTMRSRRP
jgi:hypothetical protein